MTCIALYCIVFSRSCSSQSLQGSVFLSASQVATAAAATLMPSAEGQCKQSGDGSRNTHVKFPQHSSSGNTQVKKKTLKFPKTDPRQGMLEEKMRRKKREQADPETKARKECEKLLSEANKTSVEEDSQGFRSYSQAP